MIEIKNKKIGVGKPLVCVSVMESEACEVIAEIKRLVENGAEMIEWRADAFSGINNPHEVCQVLQKAAPFIKDTIFIFTFRSKEQGGLCTLSDEEICNLHQKAAALKIVDFIDVEYFRADDTAAEIEKLQKMGTRVIASHHDFLETPPSDVLFHQLEQMYYSHADIIKLAVMPDSEEDVLRLLQETNRFHKKYPNQPLISMSMGRLGMISRIAGETFGSCITFGAGKNASAPGQIEMKALKQILEILHKKRG